MYQETACTTLVRCTDHFLHGPAVCRAKLYLHCTDFHGTAVWSRFTDLHRRKIPAYGRCTVDRSTPIDQQGLEHISAANAAEISRGLSWAKTAGLVQRTQSGPTTSGSRDLQGAGWRPNH